MNITIVRDDGAVGVNGVFRQIAFTLPKGVRVVQYDTLTSSGHLESDDYSNTPVNAAVWITTYKPIYDAWIAAAPVPHVATLDENKVAKSDLIETWCDAACQVDVVVNIGGVPHTWQADFGSQGLMKDAISMATNGVMPVPPSWRDKSNVNVPIILTDLKNIATAIATNFSAAKYHSFALKDLVTAAKTQADLDAIVW